MMKLAFGCLAHSVEVLENTVVRSVGMVGLCFEAFVSNNEDVNLMNFIVASDQTSPQSSATYR